MVAHRQGRIHRTRIHSPPAHGAPAQVGGHIGYDIRPSKRRQGYGTKILELALPKAKALGIDRVLVTCNSTNDGSRRVIEKNGGILEDRRPDTATGNMKLRYWIEIDKKGNN